MLFWDAEARENDLRFCRIFMPVIQKEIVKHTGPGGAPGIQPQKFAEPEIIISHIQAMLIAGGRPMLDIVLHLQYNRMIDQILDTIIKFFPALILRRTAVLVHTDFLHFITPLFIPKLSTKLLHQYIPNHRPPARRWQSVSP